MIFQIETCHGNYNNSQQVSISDEVDDIQAWERVQRLSPYTSTVTYDPNNSSHRSCVADFSALRKGDLTNVYSPKSGYVAGWSWTWIVRPDLACL
jgi:hypothetical protein